MGPRDVIKRAKAKWLHWRAVRFASRIYDGGSEGTKAVGVFLRKMRWPPFLATELFLPRVKVLVTNHEESLGETWIEIQTCFLPDHALHVARVEGPWSTIARRSDTRRWRHGETRTYRLRVRSDSFPREGRYALRIKVIEVGPVSSVETMRNEGVRIEHRSTMTVNTTLFMHQFKVHPPAAAISLLTLLVATIGGVATLVTLLLPG